MRSRDRVRLLAVALLAGLIPVAACTGGDESPFAEPGVAREADEVEAPAPMVLRLGVVGVSSFDPALASAGSPSQAIVADLLYDGLTAFDASSDTVVAAVAKRWSVSIDGLVWTFELDPTARFSDGSPVTSRDVKSTIERVVSLGVKSVGGLHLSAVDGYDEFLAAAAPGLRGVETPDAGTVVLRLRRPHATLDALLSDPSMGIVPAAAASDPAAFDLPVGSGPFRMNTRDTEQFGLVRSPGSAAEVDEITLRVFADGETAQGAWDAGELDMSVLASDAVAAAVAQGQIVVSAPKHVSLFYGMNVGAPILSSLPFRQAILKAVDVDTIRSEVFGDSADTMTGPIGPGVPSRRQDACTSSCAYDPEAARQLLIEAFGAEAPPAIHVEYFDEPTGREAAIALAIAEDLKAVGIPAEPRVHAFETYQQVLTSGNAELFRFGWIGAYPAADAYLEPLFASSGSDNLFNVADEALDGLLTAMDAAADATARNSLAIEAEDRALSFAAIVPIVQFRSHMLTTLAVSGVVLAPNGTFDVDRIAVFSS